MTDRGRVQTFQAWSDDFRLTLVTTAQPREIHAAISTILDVAAGSSGLSLLTQASFQTVFAPLFDLDIELPADWTVTQLLVDGHAADWTRLVEAAGQHRLRVTFHPAIPPGRETQVRLEAHYVPEGWPPQDEPIRIALPEVRLPEAGIVEGSYVVKADSELDVVPEDVVGLDPARVTVAGGRLGFVYQDTRFRGTLAVRRRPSQLSATTVCVARLEPEQLFAHLEANLQIRGGGIPGLRVSLPEATGRDLRFELHGTSTRLIEQETGPLRDGRRLWFLRFDRRLTGPATLTVDLVVPRASQSAGSAAKTDRTKAGEPARAAARSPRSAPQKDEPEAEPDAPETGADADGDGGAQGAVAVPDLLLPDADWQSGFLAIEAAGDQQLTVEAQDAAGRPLDSVDWGDFPPMRYVPKERIAATYRHVSGGYRVTLREKRYQRSPLPVAVCHRLQITSVLDATGRIQNEARFRVSSAGVQSLAVRLLPSASLWAASIDGQPVIVQVGQEGGYLIPLPTATAPGTEHVLAVFYRTETDLPNLAGWLEQTPPLIEAVRGDGRRLPVEVLKTEWTLRHPPSLLIVEADGPLRPITELNRPGWSPRWHVGLAWPSRRQTAANLLGLALVALLVVVVLAVRRKLGCRMSLAGLLVSFAVLVLIALLLLPAVHRSRKAVRPTSVGALSSAPAGAELADRGADEFQEAVRTAVRTEAVPD
ncbi:MAG TPA: hypothetical protein EYP14_12320, partial [Planctomycetaceae bacterium]|nr:hypothetical protein [Planctomycetaceae bacterium]